MASHTRVSPTRGTSTFRDVTEVVVVDTVSVPTDSSTLSTLLLSSVETSCCLLLLCGGACCVFGVGRMASSLTSSSTPPHTPTLRTPSRLPVFFPWSWDTLVCCKITVVVVAVVCGVECSLALTSSRHMFEVITLAPLPVGTALSTLFFFVLVFSLSSCPPDTSCKGLSSSEDELSIFLNIFLDVLDVPVALRSMLLALCTHSRTLLLCALHTVEDVCGVGAVGRGVSFSSAPPQR